MNVIFHELQACCSLLQESMGARSISSALGVSTCASYVQAAALEKQPQQMQLMQQHDQQQQQQQVDIAITDDHEGAGTVIHMRGPGSCSRMSDLGSVFDKLGECTHKAYQIGHTLCGIAALHCSGGACFAGIAQLVTSHFKLIFCSVGWP
jgi:hypothetical protein